MSAGFGITSATDRVILESFALAVESIRRESDMEYYRTFLDLSCTKSETIFEVYRAAVRRIAGALAGLSRDLDLQLFELRPSFIRVY